MSKRVKLTRSLEEINAEYAQLCMKLGDALMREAMAREEAKVIWPKLYKLNDEAVSARSNADS